MKTKYVIVGLAGIALIAGIAKLDQLPQGLYPPAGYGVVNKEITQENIKDNICNPLWSTKSIRPSSSYTTSLKKKQLKEMRYSSQLTGAYEEDHVISLELGGDPKDPKNLFPEPYTIVYKGELLGARQKDKVENYLHDKVCNGSMSLIEAQKAISGDWVKIYHDIKLASGALSTSDDEN